MARPVLSAPYFHSEKPPLATSKPICGPKVRYAPIAKTTMTSKSVA